MISINSEQLERALRWRYATKVFDSTRKIPAETWAALEQAMALSPSSFGLQPYRFLVVQSPALREKLLPFTWGQRQVLDCSHYVVFTARTRLTGGHLDAFIQRIAEVRGVAPESLQSYRDMMAASLLDGGPAARMIPEWSARQAYIAIGNLMTCAAALGVDACPIEGFEPGKYDELLGLQAGGFASVVCCALGYRSNDDKYAALPKVRQPWAELFQRL